MGEATHTHTHKKESAILEWTKVTNPFIYLFFLSLNQIHTLGQMDEEKRLSLAFLIDSNQTKPNEKTVFSSQFCSTHNRLTALHYTSSFFLLVVFHTRKTNQNEITSYKRTHKHTEPILSGSFASVLYILYIILLLLVRYNPILLLLSYWYVHRRKQQQKTCIPLWSWTEWMCRYFWCIQMCHLIMKCHFREPQNSRRKWIL